MDDSRSTSPRHVGVSRYLLALALAATASLLPAHAAAQAAVAPRTSTGTLRAGDRIVLSVRDEPTLTDTFTVSAGPSLTLPVLGTISLVGVRRDAVQTHLSAEITRYFREPVVTATTLVRVAVLGEVARPGYFTLVADALLSDAITEAGGPSPQADMAKAKLTRKGVVIQEGTRLRDSLASGRTLDELGMEAGDQLMVPRRADSERLIRILSLVVAIPLTVLALTR